MEGFELIVAVLESGIIEDAVADVMAIPEVFAAADSSEGIKSSLNCHLNSWKNKAKSKLLSQPVQQELNDEIEYYNQAQLYSDEEFLEKAQEIIDKLDINSPFKQQAIELLNEKEKSPLFRDYFFQQWYQSLFDNLQEVQLESLEKDREKLLQDLYQRQDTISKLTEIDENINNQQTMRLWDMAKAKLTKGDVNTLKKITQHLVKHNELQKIAVQLGRMANKNNDQDLNRVKIQENSKKESKSNSAGNIVGIKQSDELERLLPLELMFLSSPDLDVLFYKNLIEKRLSTYQQQNKQKIKQKVTHYEQQSKKADEDKGPFIIAIDASGSMMGSAEQCAKAFAYGLMQIALAENRECYVILFSAQQLTYELTHENEGLSEILNFLSYSFHGGTDLISVLNNAFNLMNSEKYKNADLIVLSDFIVPSISSKTMNKLNKMKANNNRFHALSLSNYRNQEVLSVFDQHWAYNPSRLASFKRLFSK
ncbi:ATPase RavA stimulator ViaA [Psychromonas sp. RZ22]|uniref:VWA domain-containing protein n=1 Tax=Psychromonas algarum TaxID=2555643 RepID=UPI0010672F4A|nr:VWA domain-containing protein [Psychromonas sp. RZ22]TEW53219.1 ATPase RavA stimulator ViaA [Psychromonas sp. RZ22]